MDALRDCINSDCEKVSSFDGSIDNTSRSKRPFCEGCWKAQKLCICGRIKHVVENKVKVTVMQHPSERDHHIGSVRIALLGLKNLSIVVAPDVNSNKPIRMRPKVPGSKRSTMGRGGKCPAGFTMDLEPDRMTPLAVLNDVFGLSAMKKLPSVEQDWTSELVIPPGIALLYPSDHAVELSPSLFATKRLEDLGLEESPRYESEMNGFQHVSIPTHLIVLDGTWSKAKRIYYDYPWLQHMPHYRLPCCPPSLYGGVRKQPKEWCLSTLESIVYALKILEPETSGLDGLLEVFNTMLEDQRQCHKMRCFVPHTDFNRFDTGMN